MGSPGRRASIAATCWGTPPSPPATVRPVSRTGPDGLHDRALVATRAALRELAAFADEGMTPETFELARGFLHDYMLGYAETVSRRLQYAVDDVFYGLDDERGGYLARTGRRLHTTAAGRRVLDALVVELATALRLPAGQAAGGAAGRVDAPAAVR